jgi:flagellar FliL protein
MAEKEKEKEKGKEKVEEAPPEKKSSMKWIVIAVVVLLVLGGGGFVSWKTFLSPAQEDDKKEEKPVRVQLGPTFPLEMFIVNLAGASGERYLKVSMELELKESSLTEELKKRKPQIRDTILLLLSGKTFEDVATFKGKTRIRNEITRRLNAFLAPSSIKKVYFTEFVVQ